MVITTPFKEDKKAFFYNQKIIGMNASGTVNYKNQTNSFSPDNFLGLLDWGRGYCFIILPCKLNGKLL
jgi:hypothetical protein